MIRWSYVLPRLGVVAALALTVRLGLDPALKWAFVATGEAGLGAKVDVGQLATSLRGGTIEIRDLAAANPKKPLKNLFEADVVALQLDAGQLLRKRLVVRDGSIKGLAFDTPRATSGELPQAPPAVDEGPSALDPLKEKASEAGLAWLDGLSGRFEEDLAANLQTPQLVEQLRERWPQQYEGLKGRAAELKSRAKQVEATVREAKKNPLRGVEKLQTIQQELAAIDRDLQSTIAEINALPDQAKADRAAVDAARRHDEEFLKSKVKLVRTDGDALTQYLLGEEANGYLDSASSWIRFARKVVPKKNAKIKRAERSRGVDVRFGPRVPQMLIERVEIAGEATLDGQTLTLAGQLTDLADQPELHDQPTRLHLSGEGALECRLDVTLDRRGPSPCDVVEFDCPNMPLPGRTLGKPDKLALAVAPGAATVHAEIQMVDDALTGVVELRQSSGVSASIPKVRDERLAAAIADSLATVDSIEAVVHLSGTLRRPQWKIESPLGGRVAAGVDAAVRGYVAKAKESLLAKVRGKVDEQFAELEAKKRAAQEQLLGSLGENRDLIAQLASLTGGPPTVDAGALVPKLGKAISLDKIKR
jgi:uncharacterized protein (TIGR03545 family)